MSEPMDLKKANMIEERCKEIHTRDYADGLCGFGECRVAYGFIEGTLSERRRLIERFRPVILKIQESINLMGGPVMDYSTPSANQERKKYIENGTKILIEALALFHELEKENGQ